jgi:hypothetical protein
LARILMEKTSNRMNFARGQLLLRLFLQELCAEPKE